MKEKVSKIISFTHFSFSLWNIHRDEKWLILRYIIGNVDIVSLFGSHSEYLVQFSTLSYGSLQYKIPVEITLFGHVLKHVELEGAFKKNVYTKNERTLFELWGICKYRVFKLNVNREYLHTEYQCSLH